MAQDIPYRTATPTPRMRWQRKLMWIVLAVTAAAGLVIGLIALTRAEDRGRLRQDDDQKAQCLASNGIVRTDARGWFDGCYYGNLPDLTGGR